MCLSAFPVQLGFNFESLDLNTSLLVCRHIFRKSGSSSYIVSWGQGRGHRSINRVCIAWSGSNLWVPIVCHVVSYRMIDTVTVVAYNKKLNCRRDSARCGCKSTQPKSIMWPKSHNLRPLNLPTSIRFNYALLIYHYMCLLLGLVCTSIYPPLFQVEVEKTVGSRWTCFGVRVQRTLDYPTVNLNRR